MDKHNNFLSKTGSKEEEAVKEKLTEKNEDEDDEDDEQGRKEGATRHE